jgi:drug/metabolite transporter (DMT)-like permease
LSRFSLIATVSKHDVAGIVIAVVAVALLAGAGMKFATKAVKGVLALLVLGVLAAVVAVLLLTRAI